MDTYAAGCARTYTGWRIQATVTDNTYQNFRTSTDILVVQREKNIKSIASQRGKGI